MVDDFDRVLNIVSADSAVVKVRCVSRLLVIVRVLVLVVLIFVADKFPFSLLYILFYIYSGCSFCRTFTL